MSPIREFFRTTCLWTALALCTPLAVQAGPVPEESLALALQMDLNPNQAVLDAQRALRDARPDDLKTQLRAWRLMALTQNELVDMVALRQAIAHGEPLARRLGDIEAQCQFLAARGAVELNAAHYSESAALYEQAAALAQPHGLEHTLAYVHLAQSMVPIEQGRSQSDAMAPLLKAQAAFEALHDSRGLALTLDTMGVALHMDGASKEDLTSAIAYHLKALDLLDPAKNRASLMMVYYNLGLTYSRRKDLALAKEALLKGLELTRHFEGAVGAAYYVYALAVAEQDDKEYSKALLYLDEGLHEFEKRGDLPMMVWASRLRRPDLLARLGRESESLRALDEVHSLMVKRDQTASRVSYYRVAARVHAKFGHYEKAYAALAEFIEAEKRRVEEAGNERSAEMKARFDSHRKDSENSLLRAQNEQASTRRLVLFLALALCLVVLGVLAAVLLFNIRRGRRYAVLAMRDDLTDLPNRRSITEFARLQWRARLAHEGRLRVAMLDIDHFKAVNDKYGHDVGDAVLKAFAQACAGRMRSSDRLGRYGGEEFLLVMPGSDALPASQVFQRLQLAVQALEIPGLPAQHALTFSMGVADAMGESDSLADLIHRADEALYRAKQNGRNRFEAAVPVRLASVGGFVEGEVAEHSHAS